MYINNNIYLIHSHESSNHISKSNCKHAFKNIFIFPRPKTSPTATRFIIDNIAARTIHLRRMYNYSCMYNLVFHFHISFCILISI